MEGAVGVSQLGLDERFRMDWRLRAAEEIGSGVEAGAGALVGADCKEDRTALI